MATHICRRSYPEDRGQRSRVLRSCLGIYRRHSRDTTTIIHLNSPPAEASQTFDLEPATKP
ncbi:hypothetical protein BDW75DRAFT_211762 [Aspergillus navahoensis]